MNHTLDGDRTVQELFRLDGQVALVTGGAGHLGRAMSSALAELGAHVVIASRDVEKCRALADELRRLGFQASAAAMDLGNERACQAAVEDIVASRGRIDVLVNNSYPFLEKCIDDITTAEFAGTLQAAVVGTFRLSQLVSLPMRQQGGGSIINLASMYGLVGSYPEMYQGVPACISPSYHAAKGGILQLTRYLAVYWAEFGIRVNSISPGTFPKDALRREQQEFFARLEEKVPLKRVGRPAELKGAVALLASAAGSYITGSNLVVDGGWTAW
jgi:NAD(P)-dependent dehydrogenase (short-subunit alcohol dehydrogenase family)